MTLTGHLLVCRNIIIVVYVYVGVCFYL